ncbi:MAG TPA: carbon-nitrogen hydrolase family protein, partial [Salinisphaeraceae bacterium]|nr:carbon-nitrogen hydrolase family protein [Salinisphaeraceae bacterium]
GPLPAAAQTLPGKAENALAGMAAEHRIWLVTGSIYERSKDGHVYNTASVIDPNGIVVDRYRKMFVFEPYEEGVAPGNELFVFDVPGAGRFGMTICYDTWFPEVIRSLAAMGAEVILRPTLSAARDRDVELAITRAMAATNQCYIFDINGLADGGCGRSIVCDADGHVLHQAGSGEEFMPFEVDFEQIRRTRERGMRSLGQPLKSFRDRPIDFPIYQPGARLTYLDSLGPLDKPRRAGVEADTAAANPSATAAHPGIKSPDSDKSS